MMLHQVNKDNDTKRKEKKSSISSTLSRFFVFVLFINICEEGSNDVKANSIRTVHKMAISK